MQRKDMVKDGYKFNDEINQKILVLEEEFDRLPHGSVERRLNIIRRKQLLGLD